MKSVVSNLFVLALLFSPVSTILAGEPINLFKNNDVLKLDITSNFTKIFQDRKFEFPELRAYQKTRIVHEFEGAQKELIVNMRARGWERLNTCDFPPLKIDFLGDESKLGTAFEGSKSLKHVTRCDDKKKSRWVIREYFVYKMYEKMTPLSLKVRPTWTTYRNSADNGKVISTQIGFLLENTAQMAKRNGMKKVDVPEKTGMDWRSVDRDLYLKIQLFQYMIYNFDYGIFSNDMRNIEIVKDSEGKLYPVAYDFDSAEFVRDANIGHETFLDNSTFCYRWDEIVRIWPSYSALKNPFLSVISTSNWLNKQEKSQLSTSLNNFFEMYESGELRKMVQKSWKKNSCK